MAALTLTFVVCSHNGARTLESCLKSLLHQSRSEVIAATEIIVITNGCTDSSPSIVSAVFSERSRETEVIHCIHLNQPRAGKSAALEAGFDRARGDLIAVIDDDNYLPPEWVRQIGGYCNQPDFPGILGTASKLPDQVREHLDSEIVPFLRHFAVGRQRPTNKERVNSVWGAGCVFKKSIWQELRVHGFSFYLSGRIGKQLVAGEDTELCLAANMIGYSALVVTDIELVHDIAASRLNMDYLLQLHFSEGVSFVALSLYYQGLCDQGLTWWRLILNSTRLAFSALLKWAYLSFALAIKSDHWELKWRRQLARGILYGVVSFSPRLGELYRQINRLAKAG